MIRAELLRSVTTFTHFRCGAALSIVLEIVLDSRVDKRDLRNNDEIMFERGRID